jgi:hypothetical protein
MLIQKYMNFSWGATIYSSGINLKKPKKINKQNNQCSVSGSGMFLCLLNPDPGAFVRGTDLDPNPSSIKQNLDSYCFMTSLWLVIFKNDVNVHLQSNKQKNLEKNGFLSASWRSMTKIAGSETISQKARIYGSGSVPKCHGYATLAKTTFFLLWMFLYLRIWF